MFDPLGWVQNLFTGFVQCVSNGFDCVRTALQEVGNTLGAVWQGITQVPQFIGNAFNSAINAIQSAFGGIVDQVWDLVQGGWQALTQIGDWFKGMLEGAWNMINQFAQDIGKAIAGGLSAIANGIMALGEQVLNGLKGIIGQIVSFITGLSEWIFNSFKRFVNEFLQGHLGDLPLAASRLRDMLLRSGEQMAEAAEELITKPVDILRQLWQGSGYLDYLFDYIFPNLPQVTTVFFLGESIRALVERARRGQLVRLRDVLSLIGSSIAFTVLSGVMPMLMGDKRAYVPAYVAREAAQVTQREIELPPVREAESEALELEANAVVPIQEVSRTVISSFVPSQFQMVLNIRPNQEMYVDLGAGTLVTARTTSTVDLAAELLVITRALAAAQATVDAQVSITRATRAIAAVTASIALAIALVRTTLIDIRATSTVDLAARLVVTLLLTLTTNTTSTATAATQLSALASSTIPDANVYSATATSARIVVGAVLGGRDALITPTTIIISA